MQNRYDDLNFYIAKKFPLIKIGAKDKVPIEPWREHEYRERSVDEFKNINWGVKLGTKYDGKKYLVVIDVDARNGGLDTFKNLMAAHGDFAKTMRVNTSGGGFHLYFVSDRPLGKCKIGKGIDGMGTGSYVVAAGSIHPSGEMYRFEIEEEPSDLPDFLYELFGPAANKTASIGSTWFDSEKDSKDDPEIVPEGERDNWLTRKGGQLRRIGMSEQQIFEGLKGFNEKCSPPKPEQDLRRIAKSVTRYDTDLGEDLEIVRIKTEEKPQAKLTIAESEFVRELTRLQETSTGLIKQISDEILKHSKRQYPHFALASALAIMAGVAQGGFQVPNLEDDTKGDGSVSLYQWLTSPPGSGKNSYLRAVERYLDSVDPRLVSNRVNSSYGLRSSLYCFNAVTLCIDEMQDEITRLSSSPGSPMYQVLTDIKELFNDLTELKSVLIKGSKFPNVVQPRLNLFSIGTTGGLKKHLSSELIGGGLLSRFMQWPEGPVSDFNHCAVEQYVPDPAIIERLRCIFKQGMTEVGRGQDYDKVFDQLAKVNQKGESVPKHVPQTMPVTNLSFEGMEPRKLLKGFRKSQDDLYRRLVREGLAESEISPASIVARSPQIAGKLATIAALSREQMAIGAADAHWGIAVARVLSDSLRTLIFGSAAESPFEKNCRRVIAVIAKFKEPITRKTLMQYGNMSGRDLEAVVIDLASAGRIKAFSGKSEVDLEGARKIPRGCLFSLPE